MTLTSSLDRYPLTHSGRPCRAVHATAVGGSPRRDVQLQRGVAVRLRRRIRGEDRVGRVGKHRASVEPCWAGISHG